VNFCNQRWVVQRLGLHDPLLNQLAEDKKIGRHVFLELVPGLCWIVLKGCGLGLELLVEQSQLLLLPKDILAIEGHLLPLAIRLLMLLFHLLSHLIEHRKSWSSRCYDGWLLATGSCGN